jgi:putative oxidoreductase
METKLQSPIALAGRILLAIIFLGSGAAKISGFEGTVGYIASKGLPYPELGAMLAAAVEVGGALAIVFGWKTRFAAFLLAGYCVVTAVVFHSFWSVEAADVIAQKVQFLKNLSMTGGLLTLLAWGAGGWSIDAKNLNQEINQ